MRKCEELSACTRHNAKKKMYKFGADFKYHSVQMLMWMWWYLCATKCMQFNVIMRGWVPQLWWVPRAFSTSTTASFRCCFILTAYIPIIMRCIIGILIRMESYFQLCIMRALESYFHNSNRSCSNEARRRASARSWV